MITADLVTFLIACLGAVLGVLNTWSAFRRDKVKLEVEAIRTLFGNHVSGTIKLGLKVVNLSFFPITVSDVGFRYSIKGFRMMQEADKKGCRLPLRLSMKSAHTFYIDTPKDLLSERYDGYSYVYAITACGRSFRSQAIEILSVKGFITDDFSSFIKNQSI